MADADYRSWVEVLPDFKDFNRLVQNHVTGGMSDAGTSGSEAMGGTLVAGIGKFAGPIAIAIAALGIAKVLSDAIKTGVDAGVAYLKDATLAAADLEQSIGAVDAIFKENASVIQAWGKSAAESVGLSRNSYYEFATVVGAQLKNLGIPLERVAWQTDDLIRLGADLSAQFGGSTSDAVAALSSLLRGERDPIERYGVSIKQADINARVAALGLGELTSEQERQAQILATLAILNEQTADAQGTFARESETFLNVQQRMNATLEDTKAEIGEQLLPVLTEVLVFVKDELIPLWQDFNQEMGPELRAALEDLWPILKDLIVQLLPLIPPTIELVIGSLRDLESWFRTTTAGVALVVGAFSDLFAFLSGNMTFEEFSVRVSARMDAFVDAVRDRLVNAMSFFGLFGSDVIDEMTRLGDNLWSAGRQIIGRFINGIVSMIGQVGQAASDIVSEVLAFFPHSPAEKGPLSAAGWRGLAESGTAVVDQFASGMDAMRLDLPLTTAMTPRIRPLATPLSPVVGTDRDDPVAQVAALLGRSDDPIRLDRESIELLGEVMARKLAGYSRTDMRMGVA